RTEMIRLSKNGAPTATAADFVADEPRPRPAVLDFAGRRVYRQQVVAGRRSASVAERNSGFKPDRSDGAAIRHDGWRRAVAAFDGGPVVAIGFVRRDPLHRVADRSEESVHGQGRGTRPSRVEGNLFAGTRRHPE